MAARLAAWKVCLKVDVKVAPRAGSKVASWAQKKAASKAVLTGGLKAGKKDQPKVVR